MSRRTVKTALIVDSHQKYRIISFIGGLCCGTHAPLLAFTEIVLAQIRHGNTVIHLRAYKLKKKSEIHEYE